MKLATLIRDDDVLIPAEVEVVLLPGLPAIHVLGLPDQVIKESLHRVRSALKAQGFEWPKARQVLVNIRPVDRRKTSRGLELAIAAGLLWETGQVTAPADGRENVFVYGELTLAGDVLEPDDLEEDFHAPGGAIVMTGRPTVEDRGVFRCARDRVANLAALGRPVREAARELMSSVQRPSGALAQRFSASEARLLSVAALGEFHVLLAGASGAGKTTLARALRTFLRAPSVEEVREGRVENGWRPWVAPHHTSSSLAMVGGGVPPRRGEISRADGGVLFLDELLEFPAAVQEALREPVERGEIRVSRGYRSATFPARLQLVATTNLCPCGRWSPGARRDCAMSWRRCRSTMEKISGPFFDRFDLLVFAEGRRAVRDVEGTAILSAIDQARAFLHDRPVSSPSQLIGSLSEPFASELRQPEFCASERRRIAVVRVARSLADLDGSEAIRPLHLDEAMTWTMRNFDRLRTAD